MTTGRQPFLHDAVAALHAPTQAWSRPDGEMSAGIDGVYHGDRRFLGGLALRCAGELPEALAADSRGANARFDAALRAADDPAADPHVRLERHRRVRAGRVEETLTIRSVRAEAIAVPVALTVTPDFRSLHEVKAGVGASHTWSAHETDDGLRIAADGAAMTLTAEDARLTVAAETVTATWQLHVPARGEAAVTWSAALEDPALVVRSAAPVRWHADATANPRLDRWVDAALVDLESLRLALPEHPDDVFLAAGAPWFFTLFGRDSLWAARMMLPVDVRLAASTLRVLARLQGTRDDPATEEEPGKIPHELRAGELAIPGEGVVLPPLYYGTVDATALWVCLLADAAGAGMPEHEVAALVPHLRAALDWIVAGVGDGFLSYIDKTGRGLANQGWKDSGDAIQWRDGTLARGPIALCEVQGYAYEALRSGAALLDRFAEPGGDALRGVAARLAERFRARFWVTTPEGRYPAVALDADDRPVDALTSNIGHLLGTGILSADEERAVAALLAGPTMCSGFGVRTLSTAAAGYWPLGYHVGSVWAHDSAIIAHGMHRAGLRDQARLVASGLLHAAEGFGWRMPELHSGDGAAGRGVPVPYPAACRPQAWAATAAIVCRQILG